MRFEVFRDATTGQWRWRLLSSLRRTLAESADQFLREADAKAAVVVVSEGVGRLHQRRVETGTMPWQAR